MLLTERNKGEALYPKTTWRLWSSGWRGTGAPPPPVETNVSSEERLSEETHGARKNEAKPISFPTLAADEETEIIGVGGVIETGQIALEGDGILEPKVILDAQEVVSGSVVGSGRGGS
ncbi:hypothetical protein U1Q18_048229 [Sarracenia purpurea var. burkii]